MTTTAMWTAVLAVAAVLVCGCSRARVTTELKADGSWSRSVSLTGQQKKEGMQMASLEDTFVLPSGPGWKQTDQSKGDERTLVFERGVAAGSSVKGDLSMKGDAAGKLVLVNEAAVTNAGPHRYEYRETIRWVGDQPPGMTQLGPDQLADIKSSLPKSLATDDNARALGQRTAALAIPMIFGPGEPLLAIGLMHPDLAQRRANQRIGTVLMQALEEQFGGKMTMTERRDVATRLIRTSFSSARPSQPDPSAGPPSGNNAALTPLMFVLKTPGRVISTNGERDDLTGEIYWAMYPEAALLKPVSLNAVCELDAK